MPCRISMCESGRRVCVFLCVCVCVCVRVYWFRSRRLQRPSALTHFLRAHRARCVWECEGRASAWMSHWVNTALVFLSYCKWNCTAGYNKAISLHNMNISSCLSDGVMNILISRNTRPFEKWSCVIKERREEAGERWITYKYLYRKLVYCIDFWGLGHSPNK